MTDMTDKTLIEQRASEIVRLSAVFGRGCNESMMANCRPETCEECRTQFLRMIDNVMHDLPYNAALAALSAQSPDIGAWPQGEG